jgi:hypothetical protein
MNSRSPSFKAAALLGAALLAGPAVAAAPPAAPAAARPGGDYPTAVSADYVFACMQAGGQTRQSLERCACSFDVVASLISYERYVEASTFLSMGQVTGEKGVLFRTGAEAKAAVGDLRRAQAEAEVLCFE